MKIIKQKMMPDHVLTEFEDGSIKKLLYLVDEYGSQYIEMFPNDPETWLENIEYEYKN